MDNEHLEHRLHVVSRGDLEDITRHANVRGRPGAKPPSANDGNRMYNPTSRCLQSASLELLQPDELMGEDQFDLALEEYDSHDYELSSSDEDDGITGRTSSIFKIAEPLTDRAKRQQLMRSELTSAASSYDGAMSMQQQSFDFLSLEDDQVEVTSDEERDIIRQIKNEITEQLKEEMKSELAMYQAPRPPSIHPTKRADDLSNVEPNLREAILKMRKLDKILDRKTKKEKEVKRDRILLQRRLREELSMIKREGRTEPREEQTNTMKFMALTLPPSHNQGVYVDEPSPPVTPVFHQTQIPDDLRKKHRGSLPSTGRGDEDSVNVEGSLPGTHTEDGSTIYSDNTRGSGKSKSKNRSKNVSKDYIQRNIELAADASNAIAMTDDEKKRLEDLLVDLDRVPEAFPEQPVAIERPPNPYQIVLTSGEGFRPTPLEMQRLDAIDTRLKALMPAEDFQAIASPRSSQHTFSDYDLSSNASRTEQLLQDVDRLGEEALKEPKEYRHLDERLKEIEEELQKLTSVVEFEIESPSMSSQQLEDLLSMCSRTMSRATAETESIAGDLPSGSGPRMTDVSQNPLPRSVIDQLLSGSRGTFMDTEDAASMMSTQPRYKILSTSGHLHWESPREDTSQRTYTPSSQSSRETLTPSPSPSAAEDGRTSSRLPFLPDLDPRGTPLSSQRLNNESATEQRPSNRRTSMVTVRNSFNDLSVGSSLTLVSSNEFEAAQSSSFNTPHPPSRGRSSSGPKR